MRKLTLKLEKLVWLATRFFWPAAGLFLPAAMVSASELQPILNDHAVIQYGSSVSPDGDVMYFTHAGSDFSDRNIMQARLENGRVVETSEVLFDGKPIWGGDTQISPDGKTLLFYSRSAIEREASRKDGDLFYAHKTDSGWGKPKRFPNTINTPQNEFYPVLTHSGNLYFARENEATSYDLYVSRLTDKGYQTAEKLNTRINTDLLESDAYVAPDESFIVFVRMFEKGAYGVSDLYISFDQDGDWSQPENLGDLVNFAGVDGSPFVTQDKKWLYFTSNRDAPDPAKFDTFLGVFRVPFAELYQSARKAASYEKNNQAKIYQDISAIAPYFEQGKVIFNTSMTDDGKFHYFTDNRGFDWGPTAIYQRHTDTGTQRLILEGAKIPADVHISPKGDVLYFADYGEMPGRVYKVLKKDGNWQTPKLDTRLPEGAGYMTSTRTGEIYFAQDGDLYKLQGTDITKLPANINSEEGEHDPFIAQDESFLIFVRQDSEGDSNMYLSINTPQGWSQAEKLPFPYNDNKIDGSPYVTPDKRYLFWSSNRSGDVLKTWQAPLHDYLTSKLAKPLQ